MPESEPLKPDINSKSQRKKDMAALQKIGESLLKLTEEQLSRMDLSDTLLTALIHTKSLKSDESKRRQLQYIGKLMREIDADAIKLLLRRIELVHKKNMTEFKKIEKWKIELIKQGDEVLNDFLKEYPDAERQPLRQLIRKAQQDIKNEKNTGAEKTLFAYLQSIKAKTDS